MLKPFSLYWAMNFVKLFSIDGLDCNRILSTNMMYKFLVRVVKNSILLANNM